MLVKGNHCETIVLLSDNSAMTDSVTYWDVFVSVTDWSWQKWWTLWNCGKWELSFWHDESGLGNCHSTGRPTLFDRDFRPSVGRDLIENRVQEFKSHVTHAGRPAVSTVKLAPLEWGTSNTGLYKVKYIWCHGYYVWNKLKRLKCQDLKCKIELCHTKVEIWIVHTVMDGTWWGSFCIKLQTLILTL
jgi:hypothetical protein